MSYLCFLLSFDFKICSLFSGVSIIRGLEVTNATDTHFFPAFCHLKQKVLGSRLISSDAGIVF